MDSPECSHADTDWYVKIPTNQSPFDPQGKMLLQLCKGGDAILGPISPRTDH